MKHLLIIAGLLLPAYPFSAAAQLPSRFDLRDVSGANFVSAVRSQSGGTCWTHGAMAAIESNLLVSGAWSLSGETGEPNLAEYHLDWWNGFNTFNNNDQNPPSGGLDVHQGGDYLVTTAYLSRGDGAVRESDGGTFGEASAFRRSAYHYYYPRDVEWYTIGPNLEGIETIKQAIMEHGAVGTCMSYNSAFMSGFSHYQPPDNPTDPNHAIAIVGWNDSAITQAPLPGAWICKNSWGANWGFSGFFYISYYDKHCARNPEMGAISFQSVERLPYSWHRNYFYYHDYHGWRDTKADCEQAVNAFEAPRDQILHSVSFFSAADSVEFTVTVYDEFSGAVLSEPLSGSSGYIEQRGFHTIDLDAVVELKKGQTFYLHLYLSDGGQAFDRTSEVPVLLGARYRAVVPSTAAAGQSYYYDGISWVDLYEDDPSANFCIKGIAMELAPLPTELKSLRDGGDGQSMLVEWVPAEGIDSFWVYSSVSDSVPPVDSVWASGSDSSATVTGLTEGEEYRFWVVPVDTAGRAALAFEELRGVPYSRPLQPTSVRALPIRNGISVTWARRVTELDFDQYMILRDGAIVDATNDTCFADMDPVLGSELHSYSVIAIDTSGIMSDTVGVAPVFARAAMLEPGRILAINRTAAQPGGFVKPSLTGAFLHDALAGSNYDYLSDSLYINPNYGTRLIDLTDYELLVIGSEAFNLDGIGSDPAYGGILDTLAYYLSIGGKAVVFGRFGQHSADPLTYDYLVNSPSWDDGYATRFHIGARTAAATPVSGTNLIGDLIGAHSAQTAYPELAWDSVRAAQHLNPPITSTLGIPGGSFAHLNSGDPEVLYSYNSGTDDTLTEGKIVAWRYLGEDYQYIWFDLPLSCFEEETAVQAIRRAVRDLTGIATEVDADNELSVPTEFSLAQNYPNPFNPTTSIVYSLPQAADVQVTVFNLLGQLVKVLEDTEQPAGRHTVVWDGTDRAGHRVATGIYLYRLEAGEFRESKKMLLLK